MNDLPPHVIIDLKTIYDQLLILSTRVELLMTKGADHDRVDADHESRLRALERNRWPMHLVTALVALGAAAVALVALLSSHTDVSDKSELIPADRQDLSRTCPGDLPVTPADRQDLSSN